MNEKNKSNDYRQKTAIIPASGNLSKYGFTPTHKDFPIIGQGISSNTDFINEVLSRTFLSECEIVNSTFDLSSLTGSIIRDTEFNECSFEQVDFEGSSFENASFINTKSFDSTGFSTCSFYNCEFENAQLIGVSLTNTLFENTNFSDVNFKTLSFENVIFRNCTFKNCELWDLNCEFGEFVNVVMNASTLPFQFFSKVYQNTQNPNEFKSNVKIAVPSGDFISYEEYKKQVIPALYMFYNQSESYFAAANLAFQLKKKDEMYQLIKNGLRQALAIKDFRMIKQYCKLTEKSLLFNLTERQFLYQRILDEFPMEQLNSREYHNFLVHMSDVKNLLFDNSVYPRLKIDLKSNIFSSNSKQIGKVVTMLYAYADMICSPHHTLKITLSKNSPISFGVDLTDYTTNLNVMLPVIICSTAITIATVTDKVLDIRIKIKQLKKMSSPEEKASIDEDAIIKKIQEHQNDFSKSQITFEAPVYFISNASVKLNDHSQTGKKAKRVE